MRPAVREDLYASRFSFVGLGALVTVSTRRAGDLRPASPEAESRRRQLLGAGSWDFTKQVHGAEVREGECRGAPGDGLVGRLERDRPAMFAADCALLGVVSPEGVVGAVHAGWRGLLSGVIEATAALMRARGATALAAVRGPVIGPECYEFGEEELAELVARYGPSLAGETRAGRPALDLAAGVAAACEESEIELAALVGACTSCASGEDGEPAYFSYRARRETGRHGLFVSAL